MLSTKNWIYLGMIAASLAIFVPQQCGTNHLMFV